MLPWVKAAKHIYRSDRRKRTDPRTQTNDNCGLQIVAGAFLRALDQT